MESRCFLLINYKVVRDLIYNSYFLGSMNVRVFLKIIDSMIIYRIYSHQKICFIYRF